MTGKLTDDGWVASRYTVTVGAGSSFVGRMKFAGSYTGSLAVVGRGNTSYLVIELNASTNETSSTATSTTT